MSSRYSRIIAFDTETDLIRSGLVAPPMVCLSWAEGSASALLDAEQARAWWREIVRAPGVLFVGANVAYDMAVMMSECPDTVRPVFRAYAEGRVSDVALRQALVDNALGKYGGFMVGLAELEKRHGLGDRSATKSGYGEDVWRKRYAELANVPLKDWPEAASAYAIADARGTLAVWRAQARLSVRVERMGPLRPGGEPPLRLAHHVVVDGMVVNELEQARAAFALQLMSCWGMRVDQERLTALTDDTHEARRRLELRLLQAGLLTESASGVKTDGPALFERVIAALTADATAEQRATYAEDLARRERAHEEAELQRAAEAEVARELARAAGAKLPPAHKPRAMSATLSQQSIVAAWTAAGVALPTTKTGRLTTGQDVLEVIVDADIEALVEYDGLGKRLSTFVAPLREAGAHPLTPYLNPLVESGRASSASPNIMNLPRSGGERECIVARDGHYLVSTDYSTVELRAWAQVCLDARIPSTMAEALLAGRDLHAQLGAVMMGCDYRTFAQRLAGIDCTPPERAMARKLRSVAKPANFGLPVGMGVASFKASARKSYGVDFDKDAALLPPGEVIASWKRTWTEAPAYFEWIGESLRPTGELRERTYTKADGTVHTRLAEDKRGVVVHPRSGRARGGVMFTESANTYFQGCAADAFKAALFALAAECYAVPSSPLYGARPLAPIHDEVIIEVEASRVQAATARMVEVMESCGRRYIPDIPVIAEPAIMRRWSKNAESKKKLDGTWSVIENG